MPKLRFKLNLPLFTLSIACLIAFFSWKYYTSRILSFTRLPESVTAHLSTDTPVSIQIPSRSMNLNVEPGRIVKGVWLISGKNASYLLGSAAPGTNGNIVIYGHNKDQIFGPIRWMHIGERITITTKEGKKYDYEVTSRETVNPNQVEVLNQTSTETLTLFTCTSFADSQRFIIKAKRV